MSQPPMRAGARQLWGAAIALGVGLAILGCDSKNTGDGKLKAVKAEGDPVVLTTKDGVPYITANVADDITSFKPGDATQREDALIRKAIRLALERGLHHKPYDGKDSFTVRLMVLTELDEYGKAKAGSSVDLATVEVPRASLEGLTVDKLVTLTGTNLKKLVRNSTVSLGNLDKFA
jgi:hypothetical protein